MARRRLSRRAADLKATAAADAGAFYALGFPDAPSSGAHQTIHVSVPFGVLIRVATPCYTFVAPPPDGTIKGWRLNANGLVEGSAFCQARARVSVFPSTWRKCVPQPHPQDNGPATTFLLDLSSSWRITMIVSLRSFRTAFAALAVLAALCSPALSSSPSALTMLAQDRALDLAWARNNPSSTEILDGRPLNVLLQSATSHPLGRIPIIPLDKGTVAGINLRPAGAGGNLGLVKGDGKLSWPLGLEEPEYDEARKGIDSNILAAVNALRAGKAPDRTIFQGLEADYQALSDKLDANINDLTPSDYIASERYLKQLHEAIHGLEDPSAGAWFDRSWTSTIKTVGDLVGYMTHKGLEFAPAAAPGDGACYTALYHSLRQFEAAVCR
jgi:hypothetical protein